MHGEDAEVSIISVVHEFEDGWHKFTSLEVPGLYMVVSAHDLEAAYDDLPRAIELLIFMDTSKRVSVRSEKTYREYLNNLPQSHRPEIRHYSVEPLAA
jgi:hypothetical protein